MDESRNICKLANHILGIESAPDKYWPLLLTDLKIMAQALLDAEKAFEHTVTETSGYTGGAPQEWLEKYKSLPMAWMV